MTPLSHLAARFRSQSSVRGRQLAVSSRELAVGDRRLAAILTCLLLAPYCLLTLAGCAGRVEARKPQVAVVLKALDSEFWLQLRKGVEEAAAVHPELEVQIMAPPREIDIDQQVALLENQVARRVSALVVAPAGVAQVTPVLERARASGIPVILVDTDAPWSGKLSFVGTDNRLGGRLAGEYLLRQLHGAGRVALLTGIPGVETHESRAAGFREAMAAAPRIRIVAEQPANSERALAMTVTENMLTSNPTLDAIFATNDQMALGALEAASARGRAGRIRIVAFDAGNEVLAQIRAGRLAGAIAQRPFEMGRQSVEAAARAIRGQPVQGRIDTGTAVVTRANVGEFLK
jgi:ribose transport system substrate-binding protein